MSPVLGVGVDLASAERLERALKRTPALKGRLFTPGEVAACAGRARPFPSFAARFAAKEACMKALGTGWGSGVSFLDIAVEGAFGEPPRLALSGQAAERFREMGGSRLHLSLTHEGGMAAAFVVLEGAPTATPVDPGE
jgi:holo-[acyl-carrier protein] synthase